MDDDELREVISILKNQTDFDRDNELVSLAQEGDVEAAKSILERMVFLLYDKKVGSPLFNYLAKCLSEFAFDNIPIDEALLIVSKEKNKGGRPRIYTAELAAADTVIRKFGGLKKEAAITWLQNNLDPSIDRSNVRNLRKGYTPLLTWEKRYLLDMLSPAVRQKVAKVLPQTDE